MCDCGCEQARKSMEEYLRSEFSECDAAAIREHLCHCVDCSSEAKVQLAITEVVRRSCSGATAPEQLRERIELALRKFGHVK